MHEKAAIMGDDERPIKEIFLASGHWSVGRGRVTRIAAYHENGQEAGVPWLAVYEGDWLAHRVNAAAVESVWYGVPPEAVAVDKKEE